MKKLLILAPMIVSSSVLASQCNIDLNNEIHLNGSTLEIVQASGDTATIEQDNLYIHGEKIELGEDQQAAIERYRQSMNEYLPKAKRFANQSLELANDIIDDVAVSFDMPGAFDDVKASMSKFFSDMESRYYKDGDLVLPAETFESMSDTWAQDFDKAKELFNQKFISSAFNAMSEKMKEEGGLNLTELADGMAELRLKVEERLQEHAVEMEQQGQEFCESLDEMAEQEQQLHKTIPALKDYQVFTI